jgi:hypothetical protein
MTVVKPVTINRMRSGDPLLRLNEVVDFEVSGSLWRRRCVVRAKGRAELRSHDADKGNAAARAARLHHNHPEITPLYRAQMRSHSNPSARRHFSGCPIGETGDQFERSAHINGH